jgi:hypothetical protein
MQLTKILLHGCNAFQESNKSHHHRRLLIPRRPHTQSSRDPTLLITGERNKQRGRGDPGATHASTKNASRRELDMKGILDLKGKWKKQEEEEEEEEEARETRSRERERERAKEETETRENQILWG